MARMMPLLDMIASLQFEGSRRVPPVYPAPPPRLAGALSATGAASIDVVSTAPNLAGPLRIPSRADWRGTEGRRAAGLGRSAHARRVRQGTVVAVSDGPGVRRRGPRRRVVLLRVGRGGGGPQRC